MLRHPTIDSGFQQACILCLLSEDSQVLASVTAIFASQTQRLPSVYRLHHQGLSWGVVLNHGWQFRATST